MIIRRMFATFGGLSDKMLELQPGLNIIEGKNESGKSTWCAFIRAMLYGIDTKERDRDGYIAEKNRFRPWGGAPMSGVMEVETHDGVVTIKRKTTSAGALKDTRVFTAVGDVLPISPADIGEMLAGVGREVLERSAFIETPALAGRSDELEKRVLATVSDGGEQAAGAAEARLREWRNSLKSNNANGFIPKMESNIADVKARLNAAKECEQTIIYAAAELDVLNARRELLNAELPAHDMSDRARSAERLNAASAVLENAQNEREAAQLELPDGCPSVVELRELHNTVLLESSRQESVAKQLGVINNELSAFPEIFRSVDAETRVKKAVSDIVKLSRFLPKYGLTILLIAVTAAVYFGANYLVNVYMPLMTFEKDMVKIGLTILMVAGDSLAFFLYRKNNGKRKHLLKQLVVDDVHEALTMLERYRLLVQVRNTESHINSDMSSTEARLTSLFGFVTLDAAADVLPRIIVAAERFEQAQAVESEARAVYDSLKSVLGEQVGITVSVMPTLPREHVVSELASLERSIAVYTSDAARAEGRLGGADSAVLTAELERLELELAELKHRFAAIDTARELLAGASAKLRERFSPALIRDTAQYFQKLTGGRYDKVSINRDFIPEGGNEGSGGLHKLMELSSGTADQLWLAMRLALCETVLPSDTPLVLDDAFITFDDERLKLALDVLMEVSQSRQVLVFTCHERERKLLEASNTSCYVNILC